MLANAKTDIGLVRQANEDSYACEKPKLYIVADGMGGHVAGEVASNLVVETVKNYIHERDAAGVSEATLKGAIAAANSVIFQKAREDRQYNGMGSTVSLAYFKAGACLWAHVGDSRIYLFRDHLLIQQTQDHSLVWDLVASGTITEAEAASHPQKNLLTRAVGVDAEVEIDTGEFSVYPGDKILLCSDGLTNMLSDETIREIVENAPAGQAAEALIEAALKAGGVDNVTAIFIEL